MVWQSYCSDFSDEYLFVIRLIDCKSNLIKAWLSQVDYIQTFNVDHHFIIDEGGSHWFQYYNSYSIITLKIKIKAYIL